MGRVILELWPRPAILKLLPPEGLTPGKPQGLPGIPGIRWDSYNVQGIPKGSQGSRGVLGMSPSGESNFRIAARGPQF